MYVECFRRAIDPDENRAIRETLKTYDPDKYVSQKGKANTQSNREELYGLCIA